MIDITEKTWVKSGVEVIVDDNGILWLNEKHIETKLGPIIINIKNACFKKL